MFDCLGAKKLQIIANYPFYFVFMVKSVISLFNYMLVFLLFFCSKTLSVPHTLFQDKGGTFPIKVNKQQ